VHADVPPREYAPTEHCRHRLAPAAEYRPDGQGKHADWPSPMATVPVEQATQALAVSREYTPAEHSRQVLAPPGEKEPPVHVRHTLALAREYQPPAQGTHALAPPPE